MVAVEPFLILVLALAPGLFWAWYFYRRDRFKPEPAAMIVKIFILGLLVTFPVAFAEGFIGLFVASPLLMGAVVAPIVEEYGKFAVVHRFAYRNTEFDEPMDGIVYAAAAALGLATIENVLYVFSAYLTSPSLALSTIVARALFSVPGHALFAGVWGYALGQARFAPTEKRPSIIRRGLILGMALHGTFNLLLISAEIIAYAMAAFILILTPGLWIIANRNIRKALLQGDR